MNVKFIIGYAIGVILTYSVFFGLEMLNLYEEDIKKFFRKMMQTKKERQEPTFDEECQKDMDEAWEQIQKVR